MGLFDKLFGGKKNEKYTPTTDVMADEPFWLIMETTHSMAGGNFERQQAVMTKELRKVGPQEIILFDNKFHQLRGQAYDWSLWGAAYIIYGGCGDDSFNDFREWVIAQGREFYYRTTGDPETLTDIERDRLEAEQEGMGYIPQIVFEQITGNKMPAGLIENQEITGTEWSEENDDLEKMLPRLWAKYSEDPIM